MNTLHQSFSVRFTYDVYFTENLFDTLNPALLDFFKKHHTEGYRKKLLFILDQGVVAGHPDLPERINTYFASQSVVDLVPDLIVIPGGEGAKNDPTLVDRLVDAVDRYGIDRHSYVLAVGGGSVLDLVGYVAAISHRGIRHVRIPTTVLSQNDSGVGVKNGINYHSKKNFLGSFAPPVAVFNDSTFLTTLDDRDWRSGISEAVKVALIKDQVFFGWLEENAGKLAARDKAAMEYLVHRCAELHLNHIASGDPFEMGSSRPLDFGHWSAHKLEQLTGFEVRHGEAVAIGIAMDSLYSYRLGWLTQAEVNRILNLERALGFDLYHPALEGDSVLKGLGEFREHLGGLLTIMLLRSIGTGEEVHEMDENLIREVITTLKETEAQPV
ncbi:3-dehydroquinate synthase [Larkinella soli]|uniref:3-dehydroquinate synthase n=1 Tax=Larkinella soli TaxID=1770527 RepID=UPI000FFC2CE2|nr:3-dehydroquinate synthase [Larkinella soli]